MGKNYTFFAQIYKMLSLFSFIKSQAKWLGFWDTGGKGDDYLLLKHIMPKTSKTPFNIDQPR